MSKGVKVFRKSVLALVGISLFLLVMSCGNLADNSQNIPINPNMPIQSAMTDADGNVYSAIQIGNQEWIIENLLTTKYNDGTSIPLVIDSTIWAGLTTPGFCFYNNTDSIKKFGALYNWYAVNTGKLAPTGWHVPTDTDWTILQEYLVTNRYNVAKSLAAKTDWLTCSSPGTVGNDLTNNNGTGFSALPSGFRYSDGNFYNIGLYGFWWMTNESHGSSAYYRGLIYDDSKFFWMDDSKSCGFAVRLVKD